MEVVLIRHAIAEDRATFAASDRDDALRPLTKQGRWKMERATKGLRRAVRSIDVLAASPLVRAQQTAAIISSADHGLAIATVAGLGLEATVDGVTSWLRRQRGAEVVALVGHEPFLGIFATWLMTGVEDPRVGFRKGSACSIQFDGLPREGVGELKWALTPGLLRWLAD